MSRPAYSLFQYAHLTGLNRRIVLFSLLPFLGGPGQAAQQVDIQGGVPQITEPAGGKASVIPMVSIPGGCFYMGSPPEEKLRDSDERRHRVCVEDFNIGKLEVTVKEFHRFVEETKYSTDAERNAGKPDWKGCWSIENNKWGWVADRSWKRLGFIQQDDFPVVCVSWYDAMEYIAWLRKKTGVGYRLPTEAEWEYTARGGRDSSRFWGDAPNDACTYANVADTTKLPDGGNWKQRHDCYDGYAFASPVGRYSENPFGVHDIFGNVWEWTCSEYDGDYGGAEKRCIQKNEARELHVLRGGSWGTGPRNIRSAYRLGVAPGDRNDLLGLRLAHD